MKSLITIDNFEAGMLIDSTIPATNGGQMFYGLDIHRENSILQVSQKLTKQTNVFTDLVKWFVRDDNEATYKYWALGDTGNLYKCATIDGTWALDSNVGGHGNGLAVYNGERFYCTDTQLVGNKGTIQTLDSDVNWHPMVVYNGCLFIGVGDNLSKLETDGVFTSHAGKLVPIDDLIPVGYNIKSLDIYGNRIVIGTWRGTSLIDEADSIMFTWDGTSNTPDQSYYLQECGMNALISWENILLNFAGTAGNVYAFNNAFLDNTKQIPNVYPDVGDYVYVNPGSVAQHNGKILAGFSIGSGSALGGVYTLGRKTEDLPFAITLSHPISTGNTAVLIGSVFAGGSNKFLVSWKDGTSYGVDCLDNSAKYAMGYMETQKYEIAATNYQNIVKGVEFTAEPMVDNTSITIKYKADDATSWTTVSLTVSSANQSDIIYFPFRAKVAQFKFELNCSGNNSPRVKMIKIY